MAAEFYAAKLAFPAMPQTVTGLMLFISPGNRAVSGVHKNDGVLSSPPAWRGVPVVLSTTDTSNTNDMMNEVDDVDAGNGKVD
jgi:hypothetical protein